jgi:[FeFe] hydrogenase H-cluster maturation GTPase HydF
MKGRDNKPHIGLFGRRNNGKSSLINALTGQDIAIVSEKPGTTTDPVKKSIEIFGIGPVILIDTAGIDDTGDLGKKRIAKSYEAMKIIDLAVLVIANYQWGDYETALLQKLNELNTPTIIVNNKSDLITEFKTQLNNGVKIINCSTVTRTGIEALIAQIVDKMPNSAYISKSMFGNLIEPYDTVVLITPIDSEAPEGRMILPQIQAVRDVLDHDAIAVIMKEDKIEFYLKSNPAPKLIVTDSQAFPAIAHFIPEEIPFTGFSIALAHQKGDFEQYVKGTPCIEKLQNGDTLLIMESCTHLTSCEDIGRVKIPDRLQIYTGKKLNFDYVSSLHPLPDHLERYAMIVQCGGCMVTRKQLLNRLKPAIALGIPITNYGMLLAYLTGIFNRVVKPFIQKKDDDLHK